MLLLQLRDAGVSFQLTCDPKAATDSSSPLTNKLSFNSIGANVCVIELNATAAAENTEWRELCCQIQDVPDSGLREEPPGTLTDRPDNNPYLFAAPSMHCSINRFVLVHNSVSDVHIKALLRHVCVEDGTYNFTMHVRKVVKFAHGVPCGPPAKLFRALPAFAPPVDAASFLHTVFECYDLTRVTIRASTSCAEARAVLISQSGGWWNVHFDVPNDDDSAVETRTVENIQLGLLRDIMLDTTQHNVLYADTCIATAAMEAVSMSLDDCVVRFKHFLQAR